MYPERLPNGDEKGWRKAADISVRAPTFRAGALHAFILHKFDVIGAN
jgi:hypothetical protein